MKNGRPAQPVLNARWRRFVAEQVREGRFQSEQDVIAAGLRLLEERERTRTQVVVELQRQIDEGLAALRAGDVHDGDATFAELIGSSRRARRRR